MTERIPLDQVHFVHGRPHFDFDECYTCFDDRQLLFRLVNTARRQWAFYNDTTDTVVKVRAVFAPGSVIAALQHTTLRPLHAQTHDTAAAAAAPPSTTTTTAAAIGVAADATQPPPATTTTSAHGVPAGEEVAGAQEATLEVEPGYTELFIEGTVTGFSMDFKTEAAPATDVQFVYRRPTEPYDKIYKCFKNNGNGLLFRLVNNERKQWLFYNDTREYVMKVTVEFANRDEVKPLGKTTMVALKEPAAAAAAAAAAAPVAADVAVPVAVLPAAAVADGVPVDALLAPVVAASTGASGDAAAATAPPTTSSAAAATALASGAAAALVPVIYVLLIEPGKTEPFIEGTPTVYKLGFTAEPYVDESAAAAEPVHYLHGAPDPAIIPNQSHVYKCFKNNGNGLLFRVVDDVHRIWAFYNDTTEYVMTATVHLPAGQDVQFGPGVQVHVAPMPAAAAAAGDKSDGKDATAGGAMTATTTATTAADGATGNAASAATTVDGIVATVQVPPLATAPFLVGVPAHYELVFAATPAPRPAAAEAAPQYENGKPDSSTIEFDEVYKCFKDHGNGLLFRLVDTKNSRWGFYNDTTNLLATTRVAFAAGAKVRALGTTMIETDAELGVVYVAHIPPLATVLFAEGEVDNFTTRFAATPVTDAAAAAAAAAHVPLGVPSVSTVDSPHVLPPPPPAAAASVAPHGAHDVVLPPPQAGTTAHADTVAMTAPAPAPSHGMGGATTTEEQFV